MAVAIAACQRRQKDVVQPEADTMWGQPTPHEDLG